MKIRIRFGKYGMMKYVGHLDMMRYFQKCIRRAGIDIAYSAGFSPHQIMSFAAPLGVGITSDGEYLDMEVNTTLSSEASLRALNEVMAEDVKVISYRKLKDTDKKAMAAVAAADYRLTVLEEDEALNVDYEAALREFLEESREILVAKQTKKGERTMDLKKLIYELRVLPEEKQPVFYVKACAGSADNVKPELALKAFYRFLGAAYDPARVAIHRLDVYGLKEGRMVSLSEMGEDIG